LISAMICRPCTEKTSAVVGYVGDDQFGSAQMQSNHNALAAAAGEE